VQYFVLYQMPHFFSTLQGRNPRPSRAVQQPPWWPHHGCRGSAAASSYFLKSQGQGGRNFPPGRPQIISTSHLRSPEGTREATASRFLSRVVVQSHGDPHKAAFQYLCQGSQRFIKELPFCCSNNNKHISMP
jgi:hypothetical protein